MPKKSLIRTVYLYLFAGIGLVLLIIGVVRFIDMGLKATIFTQADMAQRVSRNYYYIPQAPRMDIERYGDSDEITENELASLRQMIEDYEKQKEDWEGLDHHVARKQEEASISLAFILAGLPLYLYHWKTIKKDD